MSKLSKELTIVLNGARKKGLVILQTSSDAGKLHKKLNLITLLLLALSLLFTTTVTQAADANPWLNYVDSLKNCTPGTFALPNPLAITLRLGSVPMNVRIVGMTAAGCQVTTSGTYQGPAPAKPTTIVSDCVFNNVVLGYAVETAKQIASGNYTLDSNDPKYIALTNACRNFLNGKEIPRNFEF